MKSFLRYLIATSVAVLSLSIAMASPPRAKGHLLIIGGGERTQEIMKRFIELAGGAEKARIIILPMASSVPDTTGMEETAELKSLGARNVEWLFFKKEQAESAAFAQKFNGATGIFFSGGDQARLTRVIVGTPVQQRLKELYKEGAVMGGTSAGAAIMSQVMITGDELINKDTTNMFVSIMKGNVQTIEGIGFLDDVIIDQHFVKRKRLNRLISVVLEHPGLPGIGIDESTAVLVDPDGTFEVMGEGTVVVLDARNAETIHTDDSSHLAARNMRMDIFSAGERFNLKTGAPAPPPAKR